MSLKRVGMESGREIENGKEVGALIVIVKIKKKA